MPFEWSDDIDEASWWTSVLHPFGRDVGAVVPDVFAAYARVFHPIEEDGRTRTWADVSAQSGRIVHSEMQLHEISRQVDDVPPAHYTMDPRVSWGSLPKSELTALADILTAHTTTPDRLWCCVWEGFGQLNGTDGPRVSIPNRAYHLLVGPIGELPELFDFLGAQSPNVWWPDDRSWCVATEIDLAWTYVGGSRVAVDAVLKEVRLEALAASPTHRFTYDSDVLNAAFDPE